VTEESCKDIEDTLVDYCDGRLPDTESTEVTGHLANCEHCRRLLDGLRKSLDLAGVIWADGLAETEAIGIPIPDRTGKHARLRYAAIAAGILLALTASIEWRGSVRPKQAEPTAAEIEREIFESGIAARSLAAAELLSKYPEAEAMVKQQYRHIAETYPGTSAADKAKLKMQ